MLQLHRLFGIFRNDGSAEAKLSLSKRANMAADRWIMMCRDCLLINMYKLCIPECHKGLGQVVVTIRPAETAPVHGSPYSPAAFCGLRPDFYGTRRSSGWNSPVGARKRSSHLRLIQPNRRIFRERKPTRWPPTSTRPSPLRGPRFAWILWPAPRGSEFQLESILSPVASRSMNPRWPHCKDWACPWWR